MSETAVNVHNANGRHRVVLVCEHASAYIPEQVKNLGLSAEAASSHIAWDPGAAVTARYLSEYLDAVLVEGAVSRLLYDCNRPPESPGAMVERSELYDVPGNTGLTPAQRQQRVDAYYKPFTETLSSALQNHHSKPVLVTVHSFTPVYNGVPRDLDIGILHDTDADLANAMLNVAGGYIIKRNEPYGPEDGVTHTLLKHGIANQYANVMIEIRNTLIATDSECRVVAQAIGGWINESLKHLPESYTDVAGQESQA
jgi:predicted N-formylglutamate amidohydrolase